jgi:surface protein
MMVVLVLSATSVKALIGSWSVGKVTDMSYMFSSADAFNQDIGNWDVSNVTTMESMFYNAHTFNQDIGSWDISSLTNATGVFLSPVAVSSFAQPRKVLSILSTVIAVPLNTPVAFVKLEISQLPMSWLKVCAL